MVLYDGRCGFCSRSAAMARRLGLRVQVRDLHTVDLPTLGVDPALALDRMPFVSESGEVSYGHRAWAHAMQHGSRPLQLIGRVMLHPRLEPVMARGYEAVAARRYLLAGQPTCDVSTAGDLPRAGLAANRTRNRRV